MSKKRRRVAKIIKVPRLKIFTEKHLNYRNGSQLTVIEGINDII